MEEATCNVTRFTAREEEKKEWIEKACKWLEENVWGMTGVDYSALSDSFCQAMEEML